MTANERNVNPNVQRCSLTRTMAATTPTAARPSRLPSRCSANRHTNLPNASNSKTPPANNNNNNRPLSVKKASKLPIRTMTSFPKQATPVKKTNVSTSVATKAKKDSNVISTRAVASTNNAPTKKTIRPPTSKSSVAQNSSSKFRSRSITTVNPNNTKTSNPSLVTKRTRTTPPVVNKTAIETVVPSKKLVKPIEDKEQMNSTSSESSIEENQQRNKLLAIVQDEGYSTWSSTDVKDEITSNSLKKNTIDERRRSTGLVKNWLDMSNKRCSRKPVKEGTI